MMSGISRRLLAVFGGLVVGYGADLAEGPDSKPGLLLLGLGLGLIVAAAIRE